MSFWMLFVIVFTQFGSSKLHLYPMWHSASNFSSTLNSVSFRIYMECKLFCFLCLKKFLHGEVHNVLGRGEDFYAAVTNCIFRGNKCFVLMRSWKGDISLWLSYICVS